MLLRKPKNIRLETEDELIDFISNLPPRFLYRGQTQHYTLEDGSTSICTSFSRQGCVPPLMFRWTFYAQEVLKSRGVEIPEGEAGLHFAQALLQHYGWRSFYLDFSASFYVAAWFACNKYISHPPILESSLDAFGLPIMLFHDAADYEHSERDGHVYVVDSSIASLHGINAHNIASLPIEGECRFKNQEAWLLGPIGQEHKGLLPESAVKYHIVAPSDTLAGCAKRARLSGLGDLFPNQSNDVVLRHLMNVPWEQVGDSGKHDLRAFSRKLPLPDFHHEYRKYYPESFSFTSRGSLNRRRPRKSRDGDFLARAMFIKISDQAYFATDGRSNGPVPKLKELIDSHYTIIIELSGFLKLPGDVGTSRCSKGICVVREHGKPIAVGELVVEHPGTKIEAVGVNVGWSYVWDHDVLRRAPTPGDCACNNARRHEQHLSLLNIVEWALNNGRARRTSKLTITIDD